MSIPLAYSLKYFDEKVHAVDAKYVMAWIRVQRIGFDIHTCVYVRICMYVYVQKCPDIQRVNSIPFNVLKIPISCIFSVEKKINLNCMRTLTLLAIFNPE